ncbi:MAG: hypothetical protein E4G96_08965 [Chrysiogenales bacterium]|nr:MAG: hypothetical protein E4G96_08965 [Chrysiogenales bacterium]
MKRKRFLIDTTFQLKTTFRILGIIIIAFILIIAVTGIISMDNNRKISAAIADLDRSMEKDRKTIETLMASASMTGGTLTPGQERIIKNHLETMALMQANSDQLRSILGMNRVLLSVMIATVIVLAFVLFAYLIILTHRISGPLYVLSRHMRDIMDGNEPDIRELRKNDEFQEFYHQFVAFLDGKERRG